MGIYERDYFRNSENGYTRQNSFLSGLTPAVKVFLIANIAVFLIQSLCTALNLSFFEHKIILVDGRPTVLLSEFEKIFALFIPYLRKYFLFTQFLTYQFMHAGLLHIFFNMMVLFMVGRYLERQIGTWPFVKLYLLGGIFAGLCHLLFINSYDVPVVGASGSLCAILAVFALFNPDTKMMVFLGFIPLVMKARTMVICFTILTVLLAMKGGGNVAHLAHLGGLVFGFLYAKNIFSVRKIIGCDFRGVPNGESFFQRARAQARVYRGGAEDASYSEASTSERDLRLEEILEKMRRYGMHTLTDEDWDYISKKRK